MERSQSRLSLSASFEALAIYFPCMNSFDEEDTAPRLSMGLLGLQDKEDCKMDPGSSAAWPSTRHDHKCLSSVSA
uniref:Uncharacterized protein n=1 Tax=Sphaerodactylus townsendi TaxID=933632 RepID=A0ACB8F670_9SAUR